jgi:O-succinylbenzoate synthase
MALVDRIDLYRLRLQLRQPWKTAYGTETRVETLYVRITTADASVWYESCPLRFPDYSPACAASTFTVVREHLAPLVIGEEPGNVDRRLAPLRGNSFARDLMVGGTAALRPPRTPLPGTESTVTIPLHANDMLQRATALRHRQLRVKFTARKDIHRLTQLRKALPDTRIVIDCNGAFNLTDHLDLLQTLDKLELSFIEQPFHYRDLLHHAQLRQVMITPICLDESITCPQDAATAVEIGAAQVFNLKPGRVGGPDHLRAILSLARFAGIDCFIGSMLETPLGTLQNTRLASLPGITLPCDLPNPRDRYESLPVDFTLLHDDLGRMILPEEAEIDQAKLAPFIIEQATITA